MKTLLAESTFLNREPRCQDYLNRVLILGGDRTGQEVANRVAREGFEVILADHRDASVGKSDGIIVLTDTALGRLDGFVGGFTATLLTLNGSRKEHVGFVVAAQPAEVVPRHGHYGLKQTERILSLTDLEALLETPDRLPARRGAWLHVAFLLGLEKESDPAVLSRTLWCIERLGTVYQTQCYVFTRHLKVAAAGLERRYRECREAGTIFFKFDGAGPRFRDDKDGAHVLFVEPLLRQEAELIPDLLVVDEDLRPPSSLRPLLHAIPSSKLSQPFLQPDSLRFPGVETPKAGILAVGPSRGVFHPDLIETDVEAVAVALREARSRQETGEIPGPPQIDSEKCTMCLTCVRLCPHGAITFRTVADVDPATCVRCGICAAECPMRAIVLDPPAGRSDSVSTVTEQLSCPAGALRIVAFLCSRSGGQALEACAGSLPESVVPVVIRCAGALDLSHILHAFRQGADAVLVGGCFRGNCASLYGNVLGEQRVSQAREFLQEAGIEPQRLKFVSLAANNPAALVAALRELDATVGAGTKRKR